MADGNYGIGSWKMDKVHGTTAEHRNTGDKFTSEWNEGKYIQGSRKKVE